ncbi:hypothetical protein [Sulfobacillus harzensis]|uniref:Uncharacterized protein n=1 Tax=Sulfobacillus harzensis TaxID=2729629 RepID=A0A7Y0Q1W6_9FIRM|nr:hypothetical protein [Sulfobacillus harzensis]NMP21872.1 hypothetical protein [Sulfobacillus harzensis]
MGARRGVDHGDAHSHRLHLSERGFLFGAKMVIHQRFRLRVADAMMREGVEA